MQMTFRVTDPRTGTIDTVRFDSVDALLEFMLRAKAVSTRPGHLEINNGE